MAAMQLGQKTFIHRLDPYGSVQSICPDCFETVGQSEKEEDLARAERGQSDGPPPAVLTDRAHMPGADDVAGVARIPLAEHHLAGAELAGYGDRGHAR